MPVYVDVNTRAIAEYPENIGNHPILGASLELYVPREAEPVVELEAPVASSDAEPAAPVETKRHSSLFKTKPDKDAE